MDPGRRSRRWPALTCCLGAGALAVVTAACGGSPAPVRSLADTRAAIRSAEEVGAHQVPRAALHLKLAQDQLAAAEQEIAQGDGDEARPILARARADAELAIAYAREEGARREALEARRKVDELTRSIR